MPRQARAEFETGIFHVYARGNRRQSLYVDDQDRRRYLRIVGLVSDRMRWRPLAYCLMNNHVHLLIETRVPNLGPGMKRLHGSYAQYFNSRHDAVGHLFQGRFGAVRIESDAQLSTTAAYIARNPVEAGLCAAASDWPWSSHGAAISGTAPDWLDMARLRAHFALHGGDPQRRYDDVVEDLARGRKIRGLSL